MEKPPTNEGADAVSTDGSARGAPAAAAAIPAIPPVANAAVAPPAAELPLAGRGRPALEEGPPPRPAGPLECCAGQTGLHCDQIQVPVCGEEGPPLT